MKAAIATLILSIIVFACHRKTLASSDNITISNTSAPAKTSNEVPVSVGQSVYTSRCGRCHGLKKVENYTSQQWDKILKSMVPKAKLNDEEAKQVTAYVMEHAKQ